MLTEVILAVLERERPEVPPERAAIMAEAASQATSLFPQHPMLTAAILTAVEREGGFREDVQAGERRGKAGEICLTQIHPVNGFWKNYVVEFDDLAGLSLEATTACFKTAAHTLYYGRNRCLKQRYRTNWAQAMWTYYHYGNQCWLSPHAHLRTRRMHHWHGLLTAEAKRRDRKSVV